MRYLKLFEDLKFNTELKQRLNKIINWDLIQDAKEASLDYIDDGCTLLIYIDCGVRYFYEVEFNHSINRGDYETASVYDWEDWDRHNTNNK